MNSRDFLQYAYFLILVLSVAVLATMSRKRSLSAFPALSLYLAVDLANILVSGPILFFRKYTGLPLVLAYQIYFYSTWIFFAIESALLLAVIYSVFYKAMHPLIGLHKIGKIVFRWVAGVSVVLSFCIAFGPMLFRTLFQPGFSSVALVSTQIQLGIDVLTLCLLLFVCFSIKPLGLTYRSHIFGISLGLGVFATVQLAATAWYAPSLSVYAPVYVATGIGTCVCYAIWGVYFAIPQPKRQMVLLPTTSPYFMWNRIAEALGDEPGDVAVAGFKPDSLTPAEMAVITAQTSHAKRRREAEALKAEEHELATR
jgi:hypothetical protein